MRGKEILISNKIQKFKKNIKHTIYKTISAKFGIGSRLILIITCLLLPLAILENNEILVFNYHFNPFSKGDYYWFFSTIAQAIAALFGIGAMFTAYILQTIKNSIKENEVKARNILEGWGHLEISNLSGNEFLTELIKYNESSKPNIENPLLRRDLLTLRQLKNNLLNEELQKELIISGVKNLAVFMSFIILLSLIALLFSSYLSKLIFGFIFGIFVLLLILISVFKMVRFIFAAIFR